MLRVRGIHRLQEVSIPFDVGSPRCKLTDRVTFQLYLVTQLSDSKQTKTSRYHVQWVPVTTAWRVLRLRIEERPPLSRVAANKLNKQSWTADKVWSSSLGFGRGANSSSL